MKHAAAWMTAPILMALLLAACGGNDASPSPTPAPPATATATVPVAATATQAAAAGNATRTPDSEGAAPTGTTEGAEPSPTAAMVLTPTERATEEPTATGAVEEPSVTPTEEGFDDDQDDPEIAAVMLAVEDFPEGWQVDQEEFSDSDEGICDVPAVDFEMNDYPSAEAPFLIDSADGPYFVQTLGRLGVEDGEAYLDGAAAMLGCDSWEESDGQGTLTFSDLPFPALGDRVVARRMDAVSEDFQAQYNLVIIRDGEYVMVILHASLGDIDSALTEQLARRALEKAEQLFSEQ